MSEIQTIELAERAAEGPAAEPKGGRFLFSSWHLVLIPIAVVMVIPLVWMVITSLQTLDQTRHYPPSLVPTSMQVRNYTDVLQQAPFARWLVNTLVVTLACVAGNLLFCSLAGYAFARIRFFGRELAFILILATLMVPFQVVIIPTQHEQRMRSSAPVSMTVRRPPPESPPQPIRVASTSGLEAR